MEPRSVDVIVTSPPYNIGVDYSGYSDDKADYLEWMKDVCCACERVLKDDGHFFLQVGGMATHPTNPHEVVSEAISSGFVLQNEIVWVKNITVSERSYGHFNPINSTRFFNHTHEFIFHLTKSGDVPINRLAIGVPFEDTANVQRFAHGENLRCLGNTWFIPYETVWTAKSHPAAFPIALPEMCIKASGIPQGSLVLDPFVGSGSTLIAAQNLGMNGLGFDISLEYYNLVDERLAAPTQADVLSFS